MEGINVPEKRKKTSPIGFIFSHNSVLCERNKGGKKMKCPYCGRTIEVLAIAAREEEPPKKKGWLKKKRGRPKISENIELPPLPEPPESPEPPKPPLTLKKQSKSKAICEYRYNDQIKCENIALPGEKYCKVHINEL